MTARLLLANVGAFCLQVGALVSAAAVLARVLRIDEPKAALPYWRTILLACLLLPLCQPWTVTLPQAASLTTIAVPAPPATVTITEAVTPSRPWRLVDVVLSVLAAGIGARALWLAMGACSLRRLRREALPLDPLPASVRQAQERIGTRAGIYTSHRISGPLTFGLFRPVVMFPPGVSEMPPHVQEAMTCHELLHVRRRDWLAEITEELVRTVLWFHPAIWWLIGRIQLTREQVVDEAAVRMTESKERYVEALLAVARATAPPAFAPVSAFLRRHLLKKRVARILQETTMSTRRLIASLTASAGVLALVATFAVRSFPLEAQGRATADNGQPIQIVKGSEHLLHGELPDYPRRAIEHGISGDVVVDLTVDEKGEISDARVLSGPDELRKAALEAVLGWHYAPAAISSTMTQTTLRFRIPPAGFEKARFEGKVVLVSEQSPAALAEHRMMEIEKALESQETPASERQELEAKYEKTQKELADLRKGKLLEWKVGYAENAPREGVAGGVAGGVEGGVPGGVTHEFEGRLYTKFVAANEARGDAVDRPTRLAEIRTERVSQEMAKELVAHAGVAVGDLVTNESLKRIQEAVKSADEHFRVEFEKGERGLVLMILANR
jgi:TonB family protein